MWRLGNCGGFVYFCPFVYCVFVYYCQLVFCILDVSADVVSLVGGRWQRGRGTISEMCNLSQSPCASILNTFCAIIPILNIPSSSISMWINFQNFFMCTLSRSSYAFALILSQHWCAFIFNIFRCLHVLFLNLYVFLFSISVKFSQLFFSISLCNIGMPSQSFSVFNLSQSSCT